MKSRDSKQELKNPLHWLYLLSIVVLLGAFSIFTENNFIRIISLFFLSLIQFLYGYYQYKNQPTREKFAKYSGLVFAIILLVLAIINTFLVLKSIQLAIYAILLGSALIMMGFILLLFTKLWYNEKVVGIIILYILFTFALNYFFAFMYAVFVDLNLGTISNLNGEPLKGTYNFICFSYSVFYSAVVNFIPKGLSKALYIVQLTSSYIFHIILLGIIIQKNLLRQKRT